MPTSHCGAHVDSAPLTTVTSTRRAEHVPGGGACFSYLRVLFLGYHVVSVPSSSEVESMVRQTLIVGMVFTSLCSF